MTKGPAKILLDYGADPDIQNNVGDTALMWASLSLNGQAKKETLKILLEYRSDPNLRDNMGDTALMWALRDSDGIILRYIVRMLSEYGANPEGLIEYTMLMEETRHSDIFTSLEEIVELLL